MYPKHLLGYFKGKGIYVPEALDKFFQDEDLALVLLSSSYLEDSWLSKELHALLTLESTLRPNFVLPVIFDEVDDERIPKECLSKVPIDFRGKPIDQALGELVDKIQLHHARPKLSVFISHSERDKLIAGELTDLMLKAFNLKPGDVLCTSVEGHRIPLSANTDEYLRRRIREARVFVCIATANSIGTKESPGSFYVAVELGARWGMKRYLALLLAGGAAGGLLRAPFNTINALSCDDLAQVQQFIREVAPVLELAPQPVDSYFKNIEKLVNASKSTLS